MIRQTYEKSLTANDTGATGGHQAGIHIPKSQKSLVALLPFLDPAEKNPAAWLVMTDDMGVTWRFRYIYYNNRLHDDGGTRDEYRITHMTKYFRAVGAMEGDVLVLAGSPGEGGYSISVRKEEMQEGGRAETRLRVRLVGWRRVH